MKKPIKVLIVDDSRVSLQLLNAILEESDDIEVIAQAHNGLEALQLTKELRPDLITMDIEMPKMDGVEATTAIMEQCPTPIIVISSHANEQLSENSFNALEAGALSIIEKPQDIASEAFNEVKYHIINSIRTLASVPVVRRRPKRTEEPTIIEQPIIPSTSYALLALGSSTGGPEALNCIFRNLPQNFSIPIVVVQHITKGFLLGMVNWMQHHTALQLEIVHDQQLLLPGHVYFAADDAHLLILKNSAGKPMAKFDNSSPINYFKPSVNVLFDSLAKHFPGLAIGGLLTGMGKDGAEGLLAMKKANCYTFAQSQLTSVVFGMPGAAVSLDAVKQLVDLEKIPQFLTTLVSREGGNEQKDTRLG